MSLKKVRLELARTKEAPEGDPACGYEFVVPLDKDGHFDPTEWHKRPAACTVRRFWRHSDDERGRLIHTRGKKWVFSYAPGDDDDEPLFKFDRHTLVENEYVSVTEHDGVTRPFRIVSINSYSA